MTAPSPEPPHPERDAMTPNNEALAALVEDAREAWRKRNGVGLAKALNAIESLASSGQAASAVPEGMRLVPIEPPPEMLKAGNEKTWVLPSRDCWAAMLAASPTQPASAPAREGADEPVTYHRDDEGPAAAEIYARMASCLDDSALKRFVSEVAHGAKATMGPGRIALTRSDWSQIKFVNFATPAAPAQPRDRQE